MKNDISTREDIEKLVNQFYEKVQKDQLLAPVFSHVDWDHHLPIMYNFWSSMMLGDQSYRGNPLQKHLPLAIEGEHFDQWLKLFHETIDANFAGEKAEEIKSRSLSIASIFQMRLGIKR